MSLRNIPSGKMGWGVHGSGLPRVPTPQAPSSPDPHRGPSVGPGVARSLPFQNYRRLGEQGQTKASSRGQPALEPPKPLRSSEGRWGTGSLGRPEAGGQSEAGEGGRAHPLPCPGLQGGRGGACGPFPNSPAGRRGAGRARPLGTEMSVQIRGPPAPQAGSGLSPGR